MNTRVAKRLATIHSIGLKALAGLAAIAVGFAHAAADQVSPGTEILDRPDSPQHYEGRLEADGRGGFRFAPKNQGKAVALDPGSHVIFGPMIADTVAVPPPFLFTSGQTFRLSGSLHDISAEKVRFSVGWQAGEISLPRRALQSCIQRPGEARVLVEGFETLDTARWTTTGKPEVVSEPHLLEGHSLRIPAGGTSISYRLDEPLARGRCDIAFHDTGTVAPGRQWSLEFLFRGSSGPYSIRVNLGWSEETLAVASSPNGPSLAVQRLARKPGWHRLSLRFGLDRTEVSVDGKELANGRETDGPLTGIRVSSADLAPVTGTTDLAGCIDDLQLVRLVEPPVSHESDITQDETRLVIGDQLFGEITKADIQTVSMSVDGKPATMRWGDISGLYFRRQPLQSATVEGLLSRVSWRSTAGDGAGDPEFAEGALLAITDQAVTFQTPYAGTITIPRPLLLELTVSGFGQRIVIDATAHHLGNELSKTPPLLDPIEPEGGTLERSFELAQAPKSAGFLVLSVLEVVNENKDTDSDYWQQVREGYLRTYVSLNGKRIDYINQYVKTKNETPETIKIPIPAGVLTAGKNLLRFEQTGNARDPMEFDDLGVLQMAVEFPANTTQSSPAPVANP